jgi:hypothetical protein
MVMQVYAAELTTGYQLTGHISRLNQEIVMPGNRDDVKTRQIILI